MTGTGVTIRPPCFELVADLYTIFKSNFKKWLGFSHNFPVNTSSSKALEHAKYVSTFSTDANG